MLYKMTLLALLPSVLAQSAPSCGSTDAGTDPCKCYLYPCMEVSSLGTPITKTTTSGPITGRVDTNGYERYVGIPVAAPTGPTGSGRWQAPATNTWTATTLPAGRDSRDMTSEYPCPVWFYPIGGTENCLTVDLFTVTGLTGAGIGIYIHGGGFSIQNPFFNTFPQSMAYQVISNSAFTATSVSVYVHYRLGALGWMSHPGFTQNFTLAGTSYTPPAGASGNYGMMDGINAIFWVQNNAATFGGDSTKVTLYGESAGAAYLSMFTASPFPGLLGINAIIIESPFITYTGGSLSMGARQEMSQLFTFRSGCITTIGSVPAPGSGNAISQAACLRSTSIFNLIPDTGFAGPAGGGPASSDTAVAAFDAVYGTGAVGLFTYNTIHCWPVVDGVIMTVEPLTGWSTLNPSTTVIAGHNSDEYATFCYAGFGSGAWICGPQFPDLANIAWVLGMFGTSSSMSYSAIYTAVTTTFAGVSTPGTKMYGLANGLFYNDITLNVAAVSDQLSIQMANDAWFGNLNTQMIESLLSNPARTGSVYHYLFAQETDPQYPPLGACHGCELTYVHGFYLISLTFASSLQPPSLGQTIQTRGAASIQVGTTMNTYWAAIFNTGSPNVVGSGMPTWTPTTSSSAINTMVFQESISSTGAALNPCVRAIQCRTEPTLNYRTAARHFWGSAPTAVIETPATCTTAAIGGYSHSSPTVTAAGNVCAATSCATWCNAYTTGLSACSTCPVNSIISSRYYCAGWCNAYTCSASLCSGCAVCGAVTAGTQCYAWCNAFTCGLSGCSGCTTCTQLAAGTYAAPSWCNSYTCSFPGGICATAAACTGR